MLERVVAPVQFSCSLIFHVMFAGSPGCPGDDFRSHYMHMNSCSRKPAATLGNIQHCLLWSKRPIYFHSGRCTPWSVSCPQQTGKAVQQGAPTCPQCAEREILLQSQPHHASQRQQLACSLSGLNAEKLAAMPQPEEAEGPAVGIQIIGATAVAHDVFVPTEATFSTHSTARRRRQSMQQQQQQQRALQTLPTAVVPSHDGHFLPVTSDLLVSEQQDLEWRQLLQSPIQQQAPTRALLLGIDPDSNGAIAVVAADVVPHDNNRNSCSSAAVVDVLHQQQQLEHGNQLAEGSQQQQQQQWDVQLDSAQVRVFDMPVQSILLKKASKNAPQRTRR